MRTYACSYWPLLGLVTLVTVCHAVNVTKTCPGLQPQRILDLDQVMGSWYVVEAVQHSASSPGREGQRDSPKGHLTCAVFHLELINATTVLLEWEQQPPYPVLEYLLEVREVTSPGWWVALESPWSWPDGTAAEQVQVMKAVGDHAALTFCQPGAGGHVFTAVLGRRNNLTLAQLRGVNAMLQRRGLDVLHTRLMDAASCRKHRPWVAGSGTAAGGTSRATSGLQGFGKTSLAAILSAFMTVFTSIFII